MRLSSVPYNATEVGLWMMVVIEQHAESLQPVGNQWMLPDVINLTAMQSFGGQHAGNQLKLQANCLFTCCALKVMQSINIIRVLECVPDVDVEIIPMLSRQFTGYHYKLKN